MNIGHLLQLPPEKLKPIVDRLKQLVKNRDNFYRSYNEKEHGQFSKNLKSEDGWTKERTMKKTFSVPLEVYMSNPKYWDEVCRSKKLQKNHPEWQVGKNINKFVK
jgi:ribosomal protein S17